MKKTLSILAVSVLAAVTVMSSCTKSDSSAPGLWVSSSQIGTFAGDVVTVSGQASAEWALESVTLVCEAFGVEKKYDLSSQSPQVFNFNYQMSIPADARFPQTLSVSARNSGGLELEKEITLVFAPDVTAPVFTTSLNAQIGLEQENAGDLVPWTCTVAAQDDRQISRFVFSMPSKSIDRTFDVNARSGSFSTDVTFDALGSYPFTVTAVDSTGNESVLVAEVVVTPVEVSDPFDDYAYMYVFDADEDESQWIDGLYHYMTRQDEYYYTGKIHALKDNSHYLFAPEKERSGNLFGASPYVSSKILNKNGYVVPITIEKAGYYGIALDTRNQCFYLWDYDYTAEGENFTLYSTDPAGIAWIASGTGFSNIEDWGMNATMSKVAGYDYLFNVDMVQDGAYTDTRYYYFTDATWTDVLRCDNAGHEWFVYASGPSIIYTSDYDGDVTIYMDAALPWGWIVKK